LPYYTPWAVVGVLLMAVTGPFSATIHLASWEQLLWTAYGRVLVVKVLLVGGLLLTRAIHVFLLRPRLKKEYRKYVHAAARLHIGQQAPMEAEVPPDLKIGERRPAPRRLAQEVKLRETRLARRTRGLTQILSFEPVLGVAVLVCVS